MGPLWAPEQHTLAFRSNAPTSAHPGQTKSLCAASPLPPRPAPSTDVAPPPPPGGSPGRQPPEYGGRDVAVGTVTSPNGEHRVQPRAGDTALSRAAYGSDGTAGPGMVPSVPSRAQRKGVPVSSTSPGHGAARVARLQLRARHGRGTVGRKAGTARRCPPCASPAAPMRSGAARRAPCGRAPGPPRGTHLADGTAEALGPAHLPTQRSELHPGLYTAPVAAHPSQIVPLLFSSAAGVSRSPRRALGSTHRPTAPSRPIVPSASRALPGGGHGSPHTPTEQLRASLVVPDTQI